MLYLRTCLILMLLVGLALPNTADAQLGRLKKKLKEAAGEVVEEKAGEAAEDAVEGALTSGAQEADRQAKELNLGPNATTPASAPLIQYRTTTSLDMPGMKAIARLSGQDLSNIGETVTQDATRRYATQGETGTIMDVANKRMININHKSREYEIITFEEMAQELEKATASGEQQAAPADDAEQPEFSFDLAVNRTGKSMTVNGSSAENVHLIIETLFEASGTDDAGEEQTVRGKFFTLVDMWITKELAGYQTMRSFDENLARAMQAEFQQTSLGNMLGALGQDPRLGASMEKAAEEMKNMDGVAVRSTMYFVLAPEDAELDTELAMAPRKGGLSQMAENMSASSGSSEIQSQATLMSITTQISDLTTNAKAADLDVPAGYTEIQ